MYDHDLVEIRPYIEKDNIGKTFFDINDKIDYYNVKLVILYIDLEQNQDLLKVILILATK